MERPAHPSRRARWLYIGVGWICVGLGIAGAALPLMPGMPFFLIALWSFSRSSERFHRWLWEHPRYGPGLQNWRTHRVVPTRVRITAYVSMAASLGYTTYRALSGQLPWVVVGGLGAVVIVGVVVISRCPSRVPVSAAE